MTLTDAEKQIIADAFEFLIAEALMQPSVFVHRDLPLAQPDGDDRAQSGRDRFSGCVAGTHWV